MTVKRFWDRVVAWIYHQEVNVDVLIARQATRQAAVARCDSEVDQLRRDFEAVRLANSANAKRQG
jgi:hypothetical protein